MLVSQPPRFPHSIPLPSRLLPTMVLAGFVLSNAGCRNDVDDHGDDGAGDTGLIICPECPPTEDVYACIINGEETLLCFTSLAAAQQSCGSKPGNGVLGNGPTPCDNQSADTNADWKPSSFVDYNPDTDTHQIDEEFFKDLRMSPDQLLHDGARVQWRDDHFEFETIEVDDLADALGFQDGDRLLSINGHPLTTRADAFAAFDAVYDARAFVVEVEREQELVVLRFELR